MYEILTKITVIHFYGNMLHWWVSHWWITPVSYTVEPLYSTIGGVHEMRSCYRRIVVKYHDVVMIVTSWQKCVMITRTPLTVVVSLEPTHRQGMQRSYETYSNRTWPFCQSNCTLVSQGHRKDKSYLFLPNYGCKRRSFVRVDLRAAMFSFPSCIALDLSSQNDRSNIVY